MANLEENVQAGIEEHHVERFDSKNRFSSKLRIATWPEQLHSVGKLSNEVSYISGKISKMMQGKAKSNPE